MIIGRERLLKETFFEKGKNAADEKKNRPQLVGEEKGLVSKEEKGD